MGTVVAKLERSKVIIDKPFKVFLTVSEDENAAEVIVSLKVELLVGGEARPFGLSNHSAKPEHETDLESGARRTRTIKSWSKDGDLGKKVEVKLTPIDAGDTVTPPAPTATVVLVLPPENDGDP